MVVLVTGASGQLGQSIQFIAKKYPEIQFLFFSSGELDISNFERCQMVFAQHKPSFCINAAAYTAVDKAESEPEKAHLINVIGAQNIAEACKTNHCVLVHISTDFVFDGTKRTPYTENDTTNPLGVYGKTKLEGEQAIQKILERYFIIRTSWVYSQFGSNFMKTMLRLATERDSISVVSDQIGTPTNAVDLAECLVTIIQTHNLHPTKSNFGIYNFSNEGQCSWFDFAKKIFEMNNVTIDLKPIPTSGYPTPAKRPSYSVMDKSKIKTNFNSQILPWQERILISKI